MQAVHHPDNHYRSCLACILESPKALSVTLIITSEPHTANLAAFLG